MKKLLLSLFLLGILSGCISRHDKEIVETDLNVEEYIKENYKKEEFYVPMRDGIRLFTQIYSPTDKSKRYPIILFRTPYSVNPYGTESNKSTLGPAPMYAEEGFIFVYQDVRGTYMSEGEFLNMTPHKLIKRNKDDTDESSDTFDTIEWLLGNIDNHNGRVGQWGISYPGFYTIAGAIDTHPNLVAISPQAPCADWFFDDFHHHGAFFLPHGFNFISRFSQPRHGPSKKKNPRFEHGTVDGYQFFMDLGPLENANKYYFGDSLTLWNEMTEHPNYDDYWQSRNLLPHLKNINAAVLTVGGWYDAEDLYGPLKVYQTIEKNNPGIFNTLVMGPWTHGSWYMERIDGTSIGDVWFGEGNSTFFQKELEFPFFMRFLKDTDSEEIAEATIFETGVNKWRKFDQWPPENTQKQKFYFHENEVLNTDKPTAQNGFDEFLSDPDKPVPFTEQISIGMIRRYMTDDQRFAARRPDVLVYNTIELKESVTLAGPITVNLKVSTTGTSADWVVKLIDVYPPDHPPYPHNKEKYMGGYQQMIRSESIRGRFRNSYTYPEPFIPDEVAEIHFELQDVLHTFKKGHKIMIQIQSTWFPLIDRNPQKYVDNIFKAEKDDFIKAWHRVYRNKEMSSFIEAGILKNAD